MKGLEPKECLDIEDIERHLRSEQDDDQDSWLKSHKARVKRDAKLYTKENINAADVEDLLVAALDALKQALSNYLLVDGSQPIMSLFKRVHQEPKQKSGAVWYRESSRLRNAMMKHFLSCNRPQQLLFFDTQNDLPPDSETEREFYKLAKVWRKDVAFTSFVEKMAMHPAYQRIIGMGPVVVPLILRDLEKEPDHWFWALHSITGADPVDPKDAGDIDKMAQAWVKWGRELGLI